MAVLGWLCWATNTFHPECSPACTVLPSKGPASPSCFSSCSPAFPRARQPLLQGAAQGELRSSLTRRDEPRAGGAVQQLRGMRSAHIQPFLPARGGEGGDMVQLAGMPLSSSSSLASLSADSRPLPGARSPRAHPQHSSAASPQQLRARDAGTGHPLRDLAGVLRIAGVAWGQEFRNVVFSIPVSVR